jgi:hypothetical protein
LTPIPVENFNVKRNQKWDGIIHQALAEKNSSRAEQNLSNLNHQVSELKRNAFVIVFAVAYSAACFGQSGNDPSSKVELRLSQNNDGSVVT